MCKKDEQLCWECQRATGGCSWSTMGKPVEGWTAEKTKIPNGCAGEFTDSYKITACPLFKKDEKREPVLVIGERISLEKLGAILGIRGEKIKPFSDEKIIDLAQKKGVEIQVVYGKNRSIFVTGVKKWSGVKSV